MEQDHKLKVFISHLSKHQLYASQLAEKLESFNIKPFVAHVDINPTQAWQLEIEKFLGNMDCMLCILHEGFFDSIWCNQEIGYSLGKGTPIISMKMESYDPQGFIGQYQAYTPNQLTLANNNEPYELIKLIYNQARSSDLIRSWVINSFAFSNSYDTSNNLCDALENLDLTHEEKEIIKQAYLNNSQVTDARNMKKVLEQEWIDNN